MSDPERPPAAVLVRPARADDAAALVSLFAEVDALHAAVAPGFFRGRRGAAPDELPSLLRMLGAPDVALLVAERARRDAQTAGGALDGRRAAAQVVGLVHAQLFDTPPSPTSLPRRRVHVERVVVARAARRSGVGRRLMDAATDWATSRGATQIVLTVWRGNDAADQFYRALGYAPLSTTLGRDLG